MLERLLQGVQQGREWLTQFLSSLSPQQKTLLLRGVPVLLVALAVGLYLLQRTHYRPLFTNLSPQDAAAVVSELEAQKIPYTLSQEGTVIEVPAEVLYRTRLNLVSKGLPQGSGVGFELFDHVPFGTSKLVYDVNYLRALQGELSRTINAFDAVESSRVLLVLPERSTFLGPQDKPRASVMITLRPGYRLTGEQAQGISALVAGSVAGLVPEEVAIVDSSGRPVRPVEEKKEQNPTAMLHQLKGQFEQELEGRIQTLLEPVLGPGRTVARATVELDYREKQRTEEAFDPAGQVVRSEQKVVEAPAEQSGGVPGVQTNIPGGDGEQTRTDISTRKSSQTANYEITKTTRQIVEPSGQIRRLSVAVMVDGKYEGNTYSARTPEEMEALRAAVMKAVGFNAERGDQVEVVNMPFARGVSSQEPSAAVFDVWQWLQTPQGIAVGGSVLVLLALLGVSGRRRRSRRVANTQPQITKEQFTIEATPEAAESLSAQITVTEDPRREQLTQLVRDHKEFTVQLIRLWLKEGSPKKKGWGEERQEPLKAQAAENMRSST